MIVASLGNHVVPTVFVVLGVALEKPNALRMDLGSLFVALTPF